MPADLPFESFTDAQLKSGVDRLVEAFHRGSSAEQERVGRDAELLREELVRRLRERGEDPGDEPSGGVREPHRPGHQGGPASVSADPGST